MRKNLIDNWDKEKYLFSAIIRRDGSTKFGPENRFGYFPTASAGWVLSDESFLENAEAISFLKIRSSYGILGNDRIPDYRYVSLLNGQGEYVINGELVVGIAIGALSNPQIKWEQQQSFDVGFDARLFNNQVTIAADYFDRKTKDLLLMNEKIWQLLLKIELYILLITYIVIAYIWKMMSVTVKY